MTIKLPQPSMGDKILKLLGKKRGIKVPSEVYERFGPYVYATAKKEPFWKALLRSADEELPEDMIDVFYLDQLKESDLEKK
jgi:hypothetical protein